MNSYLRIGAGALLAISLLLATTINLKNTPPLWWDEGWTLSVARNWVELGHYGRFLDGQPIPPGLEAAFPVTAGVTLSFLLFGVGIDQARLVIVIFTLGALALLYHLACRLYDRPIGLATLAVLIFMTSNVDLHPLVIGRQVLGELPAIFFLLAGFACFLRAGDRSLWFMPAAICLWAISLVTKAQLQPFWAASLLIPLTLVLFRRRWRLAGLLGTGLIGSAVLSLWLPQLFLQIHSSTPTQVSGLYPAIALVFAPYARWVILTETFQFGMPTLLGLCYGLWCFLQSEGKLQTHTDVVRLSLLILAGSWFAWYVTLSVGWPRYLFPPVFIGSLFVTAMLSEWTNGFSLSSTFERAGSALRSLHVNRGGLSAIAAVVLITISFARTLPVLHWAYFVNSDDSVIQTAEFLNTKTASDVLIETYESELFFFLKRRYHYPPDQIHVELTRRALGERVSINYDPVTANPDYLVVGHQSKFWKFYDPYLQTGAFRLLHTYGRYEIYKRVR